LFFIHKFSISLYNNLNENYSKKEFLMEIVYKVFEFGILVYFIYIVIKLLKCKFGKCDIK